MNRTRAIQAHNSTSVVVLALGTFLAGCSPSLPTKSTTANTPQSARLDFSADEFRKLAARVDELETTDRLRKLLDEADREAYLKTTAQEYTWARTELGVVTVNISNVSEYANGSQVVLTFGNPTSAILNRELASRILA